MDRFVESCEAFRAKDEVLQSIPSIGPQVSRTMLAHLPELGKCSRQKITALVGLAPTTMTADWQTSRATSAAAVAKCASVSIKRQLSPSATVLK